MENNIYHIPVMTEEVINSLNIKKNGIYFDGTLGGGGHAEAILKREGFLIAVDRDQDAINFSSYRLNNYKNKIIEKDNFHNFEEILYRHNIDKIDGCLLDLGISSHQIDDAKRGFSYMHNSILDMRMDTNESLTAYEVVNNFTEDKLSDIFKNYGDERYSKLIANKIVIKRKTKPIETTLELSQICKDIVPNNYKHGHPAKKIFQALRIYVNEELHELDVIINKIVDKLNKNSRLCIITFHSTEDRIVKNTFKNLARNCICSPDLQQCICSHKAQIKILGKKKPTEQEIKNNKRAKSAILRIAEKMED